MPPRRTAAQSRGFIVLLALFAMVTSLALDMSLPALPTLASAFAASPDMVQLTLSLFFLGYAGGQLFFGPLSDRIGRRRALMAGLGLYTIAGFLSAFSTGIGMLVALRCVQGVSAASGQVLARAIIRDHFSGARGAQALSAVLAVMAIAPLVSPFVGGLTLKLFGWRAIFVLLGILGLGLLLLGWLKLGESLARPDPQALYPLRLLGNYHRFLSNRRSLGYTLVNAAAFSGLFAYISGSPFVLIEVYHLSSTGFGLVFGLSAVGFMIGSIVNNRLARRLSLDRMLALGFAILLIASALLFACTAWGLGGAWGIVLPFILFTFGLAQVMPTATAAAMEPLPEIAGIAAAVLGATQMAAGSLSGYVVNALFDHTALPMAGLILAAPVLSVLLYLWLVHGAPERG